MGFQEVAKYLYFSGTRAPAEVGYVLLNKDSWNGLPDDLKALVMDEWRATVHYAYNYTMAGILVAVQNFKDYGCELYHVPPDIEEALLKEAEIYYGEKAAADPFYAEVLRSELEFSIAHQEQLGFDTPATDYMMQFRLP
jgi:TRAP-type mannitol/chloroaromatic compound transport system substrate-binding protein